MNSHRLLSAGVVMACLLAACGGSDDPGAERAGQAVDGGALGDARPGEPGGEQSSRQSGSGDQSVTQSQSSAGGSQSSSQTQSGGGAQSSTQSQSCTGGDCTSSAQTSGATSVKTFSGTGRQTISFNVEEPSVLSFTAPSGREFTVRGEGIAIDQPGGEGRVELRSGDYKDVRVDGESWTIVVRPR